MLSCIYKPLYRAVVADQPNPSAQWESNFIEQMKRLRDARGMTQTDLARQLNTEYGLPFHQPTVQRIESGERPVRLNEAHAIAEVLEVDVSAMVSTRARSAEEMRYAVDRVHDAFKTASHTAGLASDQMLQAVGRLVDVVSDRLAGDDTSELDPITRWGLSWAFKTEDIQLRIATATNEAVDVATSSVPRRGGMLVQLPGEAKKIENAISEWRERYGDLDSALHPNRLYAAFPSEEEAGD